jgi:hypothetical protein
MPAFRTLIVVTVAEPLSEWTWPITTIGSDLEYRGRTFRGFQDRILSH